MLHGVVLSLPSQILAYLQTPPAIVQPSQRPKIVRGRVTLEADHVNFKPDAEHLELTGNVVATYEQTKLSSDRAEIDTEKEQARFQNGVQLTDPIGTLTAEDLFFDYKKRTGYAHNIKLQAYEAHFEGEELIAEPDAWRLKNAWFTTCLRHYKVYLTDVVIKPGQYISARRSSLQVGRFARIPLPFFRVGLNPQETGLQAPVPSIDENFKLGYRWQNSLALNDRTIFQYNQSGGQKKLPSVDAELAYSLLPREGHHGILTPRSEDFERFVNGYLDDVIVRSMEQENESVGDTRALLFAGHTTNINTRARPGTPEALDRPVFAGVEAAGKIGPIFADGQIRYGRVKQRLSTQEVTRTEIYGTALIPEIAVGKQFSLRFRADVGIFSGGSNYGWLRPLGAVVYKPSQQVQLSAGYFATKEWGTPLFNDDQLYSKHAAHFRADLNFPATDISFLAKYDFDKKNFYDFEISIGQVAECIRPFVSYRKFPGAFAIGFTLRADKLLEALKRREQSRGELPPP